MYYLMKWFFKKYKKQSVINFLNKEHHSVSLNKKVKYADMELTQFINTIAKDLEARDLLKEASWSGL